MGITRTYLSLGECALYRHTLRDRLYHRRSSRDHVRFGGLFQLLVRRGSVYPFPVDSIGHNALASLIYFGTFWAFLLQSITGFGLYAKMSQSFFPQLFAWTIPLMGGDLMARQIHHFLMWFLILFAIVHIYLVFYHDYIEQRGETSSIIETITKIAKKG